MLITRRRRFPHPAVRPFTLLDPIVFASRTGDRLPGRIRGLVGPLAIIQTGTFGRGPIRCVPRRAIRHAF